MQGLRTHLAAAIDAIDHGTATPADLQAVALRILATTAPDHEDDPDPTACLALGWFVHGLLKAKPETDLKALQL